MFCAIKVCVGEPVLQMLSTSGTQKADGDLEEPEARQDLINSQWALQFQECDSKWEQHMEAESPCENDIDDVTSPGVQVGLVQCKCVGW